MKIIIAGAGKVGKALAKQLSSEGHDLTIIDQNSRVLEDIVLHCDAIGVQGNCITRDILLQAGVEEANLLITTTHADEINLLSCIQFINRMN